jgi:ubiquinone/menaquinone biosynthesis C-methylase UbiE
VDSKAVYETPDVVCVYEDADYLEVPEQTLLDALKPVLPTMSMLDMAVGAGRTTRYFAPQVRRYVALDFSRSMIDLCNRKFAGRFPDAKFVLGDMRDLSCLGDERFDLVLISYNSVSPLYHEDRLAVFRNVRQVCRPGAWFMFSAHNIYCLPRLYGVAHLLQQMSLRAPKASAAAVLGWLQRRLVYDRVFAWRHRMRDRYRMVNDGAHFGRLEHYYVQPTEQVAQLLQYFDEVAVYRPNGEEVQLDSARPPDDHWLFYLCRVS